MLFEDIMGDFRLIRINCPNYKGALPQSADIQKVIVDPIHVSKTVYMAMNAVSWLIYGSI